jgi:hypothetical protein
MSFHINHIVTSAPRFVRQCSGHVILMCELPSSVHQRASHEAMSYLGSQCCGHFLGAAECGCFLLRQDNKLGGKYYAAQSILL